jgi:hypothetical protein
MAKQLLTGELWAEIAPLIPADPSSNPWKAA